MVRSRFIVLASVILLAALVGCGSSDEPAGPTEGEVAQMIEAEGEEVASAKCVKRDDDRLFGCTVEFVEWPSSVVRAEIRVGEEDAATYFVEDCEGSGPEWAEPDQLCGGLG